MSGGKVRPLSGNSPSKPFALAKDATRNPVNDKDNAQSIPQPPRATFIPHPQLAPPGMGGTRPAFKPLVRSPDRDRTRDR